MSTSDPPPTDSPATDPPPDHSRSGRRSLLGLAGLLSLSMAVATITVPTISVLAPFLREDLGAGRGEIGLLVTGIGASSALLSPLAGQVTDRLGGRRVLLGVFAVGTVAILWMAAAPSLVWLSAVAIAGGIINASGNPGTNKLITAHVPLGERGLVMGIKQSGVQAGVMTTGLLPALAVVTGWRGAAATLALVSVAGGIAAAVALPADPTPDVAPPVGTIPTAGPRYRHPPMVWWLAAYSVLMGAGTATVATFLPLYAEEAVGVSATHAGALVVAMGAVGVAARLWWGLRVERRAAFMSGLATLGIISLLAALSLLVAADLGVWPLWGGTALSGFSVMAWNVVLMLATVTFVGPDAAGRATGLVYLAFMCGFTASPALLGLAADATDSYAPVWGAATVLFTLSTAVALRARRVERVADAHPGS